MTGKMLCFRIDYSLMCSLMCLSMCLGIWYGIPGSCLRGRQDRMGCESSVVSRVSRLRLLPYPKSDPRPYADVLRDFLLVVDL
ncbi:hypothetical protein GGS24DRAFT_344655 [Hypoxylon argillaceum]|nr:hypothetical protein GGS24DRAFT_344655 [Hypoxylon argillaceum]